MGDRTHIEWADSTWNPVTGCTRISPGCDNCYIDRSPPFRMAGRRFAKPCGEEGCPGHAYLGDGAGATTGVLLHSERLEQPLRWRRPRRVFVCSLADLFHGDVPDGYIAQVWAAMAMSPRHTFQVLTKRPARMRALLSSRQFREAVEGEVSPAPSGGHPGWPLPNVWIGVTAEDQERADQRIPILLDTPAAVRWLSVEPMIGPVDLRGFVDQWSDDDCPTCDWGHCPEVAVAVRRDLDHEDGSYVSMLSVCARHRGVDWVVCGGESGARARPMDPAWARSLRDQCMVTGIAFFFKQCGEWGPDGVRVGKGAAGRHLDQRTWDQYPGATGPEFAVARRGFWRDAGALGAAGHEPWGDVS